jgi:translocator protein
MGKMIIIMLKKNRLLWNKLIASILICQGAGFVGSLFTTPNIDSWYAFVNKPSFNPPNFIFAPVWTLLFLMMGVSLYLLWVAKKGGDRKLALRLFFIQLGLNVLWSIIFFGMRNPGLALVEIVVLWFGIFFSALQNLKVNKWSFWLMVPYLAWVSFAFILNFYIFILN